MRSAPCHMPSIHNISRSRSRREGTRWSSLAYSAALVIPAWRANPVIGRACRHHSSSYGGRVARSLDCPVNGP